LKGEKFKMSKGIDTKKLEQRLRNAIIGFAGVIDALITAYENAMMGIDRPNVLLYGSPGVGKTFTTKAFRRIAAELSGNEIGYARIQGRADLMPEEFLAERISEYDEAGRPRFVYRLGAVGKFKRNGELPGILHFDEIDKTPARSQQGLLEAMEEQQLSLPTGEQIALCFMLVATANTAKFDKASQPIPRATQDRFSAVEFIDYLPLAGDVEVLQLHQREWATKGLQVTTDPALSEGLVKVVKLTQRRMDGHTDFTQHVKVPIGPRGFLDMYSGAAQRARRDGRNHLTVDDIRAVAIRALRGRLEVKAEAEIQGKPVEVLIQDILAEVFDGIRVSPLKPSDDKSGEKEKKEEEGEGAGEQDQPKDEQAAQPEEGKNNPPKDDDKGQGKKNQPKPGREGGASPGTQPQTSPTGGQGKRPSSFLAGLRQETREDQKVPGPFPQAPR